MALSLASLCPGEGTVLCSLCEHSSSQDTHVQKLNAVWCLVRLSWGHGASFLPLEQLD